MPKMIYHAMISEVDMWKRFLNLLGRFIEWRIGKTRPMPSTLKFITPKNSPAIFRFMRVAEGDLPAIMSVVVVS